MEHDEEISFKLINKTYTKLENISINKENIDTLGVNFPSDRYLIILDVYKAYDFVNLDLLDNWIRKDKNFTIYELKEWEDELQDLKALNFNVSGQIIKRTRGLPQGSELSPILFNYYMSRILEMNEIDYILREAYVTIYADNIFIVVRNKNLEYCKNLILQLTDEFMKYNFSFNADDIRIERINGYCCFKNIRNYNKLENVDSFKILGVKFHNINNKLVINPDNAMEELICKHSNIPYKMVKIAKRYIVPKYRFYYNSFKIISDMLAENYNAWFKKEFRKWLKVAIISNKISDDFIDYILGDYIPNEIKENHILGNNFTYWIKDYDDFNSENTNNYVAINKIKDLARFIWKYKKRLNAISIIGLLYNDSWDPNRKNDYKGNINKSFEALDRLYNCFIANKNPNVETLNYSLNY